MSSSNRLKEQVQHIINTIENGIEITQDDIDLGYVDNCMYEVGDIMSGFDYLSDALDIEYIVSADKTYKGARVLVAFGGPNIWINTLTKEVEGYWWGDKCIMSYHDDAFNLDECLEEIYSY